MWYNFTGFHFLCFLGDLQGTQESFHYVHVHMPTKVWGISLCWLISHLSSHLFQLFSLVLSPPSSFTQEMGQIFFVLTLINLSEYFVVVIFLRNPGLCPQCSRNRTFLLLLSLQLVFLPFAQGNLFSSRLEVGAY